MTVKGSPVYSDFDIDFTLNPATKDLALRKEENAVKQSIKNLLLTNTYERPFRPLIGADLSSLLFDQITPTKTVALKQQIATTLANYEPRAQIIDIKVTPLERAYSVTIVFSTINNREPLKVNIVLERIR